MSLFFPTALVSGGLFFPRPCWESCCFGRWFPTGYLTLDLWGFVEIFFVQAEFAGVFVICMHLGVYYWLLCQMWVVPYYLTLQPFNSFHTKMIGCFWSTTFFWCLVNCAWLLLTLLQAYTKKRCEEENDPKKWVQRSSDFSL